MFICCQPPNMSKEVCRTEILCEFSVRSVRHSMEFMQFSLFGSTCEMGSAREGQADLECISGF